jgi:hypothetical protein
MPNRMTPTQPEDVQDGPESTVFRSAAQSLREMVEVGDHPGITLATAFALCRMLDAAAGDVSAVEPRLRFSLLRVADMIRDRHTWAPRVRQREESSR